MDACHKEQKIPLKELKDHHHNTPFTTYNKSAPGRQDVMIALQQWTRPRRLTHILIAYSYFHSNSTNALNIALLTGSTRTSGPPTVLHPRVNTYINNILTERGHKIHIINPNDFPLLEKPYFAYPPGKAPEKLQEVNTILQNADGYVCVTPEYNHSPSPALLNILNHFGSSTFSFKPSAIGMCSLCRLYTDTECIMMCILQYENLFLFAYAYLPLATL